jgi:hypothetical protein
MNQRSAGLTALVAALGFVACYSPNEFRGAGPMIDRGFWSFPRYRAPIGEFPLAEAGTYEFHFSGVPSGALSLSVYVLGHNHTSQETLSRLTTSIDASVVGPAGVLCHGAGRPTGSGVSEWTLMSSSIDTAFYHTACLQQAYGRHVSYTLRVVVTDPDPRSPRATLQARLEGLGNEWP